MKFWSRFSAPLGLAILGLLPPLAGLAYALAYSLGWVGALTDGFQLNAWRQLFSDAFFWKSLGLSALLSTASALLSAALAIALTLGLRLPEASERWQFWWQLPSALPPLAAAFVSYQWLSGTGLLARLLHAFDASITTERFPALVNDPWYTGVWLTLVLSVTPVMLLLCIQHFRLKKIDELKQLATALGASARRSNWTVSVPVLWQSIRPACVAYGIFLFGAFEIPLVLGRQNPAMISVFIHQKLSRFNLADIPVAYAAVVVYALLVFSVTWLLFKRSAEKINELV